MYIERNCSVLVTTHVVTYHWTVSQWSEPEEECGEGVQTRVVWGGDNYVYYLYIQYRDDY